MVAQFLVILIVFSVIQTREENAHDSHNLTVHP